MFGSRGFESAAYPIKFLHTQPRRRGWVKFALVFVAGAACAVAIVRPEVRSMAASAGGMFNAAASEIASAFSSPERPNALRLAPITNHAPQLATMAPEAPASASASAAVRPPEEKVPAPVRVSTPATPASAPVEAPAAASAAQPPEDARAAATALERPKKRTSRRAGRKATARAQDTGEELMFLGYDRLPNGERIPVYRRIRR